MQLYGFNLHGLSCYYNVGEVVKKNVSVRRWNSINSYDESIRNAYDEKRKRKGGLGCPAHDGGSDLKGETRCNRDS
jgi:hypothetical protein